MSISCQECLSHEEHSDGLPDERFLVALLWGPEIRPIGPTSPVSPCQVVQSAETLLPSCLSAFFTLLPQLQHLLSCFLSCPLSVATICCILPSLCHVVCVFLSSCRLNPCLLSLMIPLPLGHLSRFPPLNSSLPFCSVLRSFSATAQRCEICPPSGYKSIFVLRNTHCGSTTLCVPSWGGISPRNTCAQRTHAQILLSHEDVMEEWILMN